MKMWRAKISQIDSKLGRNIRNLISSRCRFRICVRGGGGGLSEILPTLRSWVAATAKIWTSNLGGGVLQKSCNPLLANHSPPIISLLVAPLEGTGMRGFLALCQESILVPRGFCIQDFSIYIWVEFRCLRWALSPLLLVVCWQCKKKNKKKNKTTLWNLSLFRHEKNTYYSFYYPTRGRAAWISL